ncbi:hypothetical protein HDE77_001971 [Rhodanobacter sp. MP7CTX1]|jgi:hypothetical protein|nr:hypothetical protein [Rhodanobacter sp. MP7CTX1]
MAKPVRLIIAALHSLRCRFQAPTYDSGNQLDEDALVDWVLDTNASSAEPHSP